MGRAPCCLPDGAALRKGAWTAEEDKKLLAFISSNNGHGSWRTLPELAGLQRCGKSCRLRWTNYLRPNIKRGNFTCEEESTIIELHQLLGNRWSSIASRLPGRTDNEVKNHWNTHLKKRLSHMGIDPVSHRPASLAPPAQTRHGGSASTDIVHRFMSLQKKHMPKPSSMNGNLTSARRPWPKVAVQLDQSFVSHMAQWELARLEAEARLMAAKPAASVKCSSSAAILGRQLPEGIKCSSSSSSSGAIASAPVRISWGQAAAAAGGESSLLEVFRELWEAHEAEENATTCSTHPAAMPSLHTSTSINPGSSSSACSQFLNEAEITSELHMFMEDSCMSYDPLLGDPAAAEASDSLHIPSAPAATEAAGSQAADYWANMLSLAGAVMASCAC